MCLISVLTPTYNRAQLLKRSLQSVLQCDRQDIEVLVADNASPDETQEVLASFSDLRLRSWRQETNIGAARNGLSLLKAARGEWVFFLTDDDYLVPGALDRLADVLLANPEIGGLTSHVQNLAADGTQAGVNFYHLHTAVFSAGHAALSNLVSTAHLVSRVTVKRQWMDITGFEQHMDSDYPQMYLLGSAVKEHPGLYLAETLINHTVGNQTFWEYKPDFMVGDLIQMWKDLLPGPEWKRERETLTAQTIRNTYQFHMPMSLSKSKSSWVKHQLALWKTPEVVTSSLYWRGLSRFVLGAFRHRLRSR